MEPPDDPHLPETVAVNPQLRVVDSRYDAALFKACAAYPDIDLVKLLISQGANVNATDDEEKSPLHVAAGNLLAQDTELISLLVDAGADVNAERDCGDTPLFEAIRQVSEFDSELAVKFLLDKGAHVNVHGNLAQTPLHVAVEYSSEDTPYVIDLLLEHGADINARDAFGRTALHEAVSGNHSTCVSDLIRLGANVNAQDDEGNAPIHLIHGKNFLDWPEDTFDELMRGMPNVNLRNNAGEAPIHIIIALLSVSTSVAIGMIERLCNAGADASVSDANGDTAAHLLAHVDEDFMITQYEITEEDLADLLSVLTRSGADLLAKNNDGKTPADIALECGNKVMYGQLVG